MPSRATDPERTAGRRRRWIAAGLLVLALAAPIALERRMPWADAGEPAADAAAVLERHGFVLEDVASSVGVDFVHEAPRLDPRLDAIMPLIASLGASVSVVDYDRDGWPDLYATTSLAGGRNALYRNLGDGTFQDVAERLGIADLNATGTGASMGGVWGDFTNDGYEDLFLYKWGPPELYRNDAGEGFTRVPHEMLDLPRWINANTAIWLDFDRDGWLDLFVGAFYRAEVNLWDLQTMRFLPESFEYAQDGGRNYLLRNRGDGTFEDRSDALGLTSTRWTLAAAAADVTGNGYPDLLIANDFGVSELYLNERGERLREVGRASSVGRTPKSGMNASFGDLFNRGEWGAFVSNIAEPGILMHGNDLWMPGATAGEIPNFRNLATALGVDLGGWTYGAQLADLDNSGWLDLVVANGFVSGERRQSYWYDYSKVATGYRSIIADARNWPPLDGRSLSGYQRTRYWTNDGAGGVTDASAAVLGDSTYDGRAVAVADLWNRGVLDVIIANQGGPLQLLRNRVAPDRNWITFELTGSHSNRSAIGAELRLFWDGRQQLQQVEGGSGFAAQRDRRLHFGLGTATYVDSVVVRWPSGIRQVIPEPAVNTRHSITEPR